jgi:SAM-dependent methyltransferase
MPENEHALYFAHLTKISFLGRVYKRYFSSRVIHYLAKSFGSKIAEIGSGTGNGVLGAYPKVVTGFEINALAVDFCRKKNLNVHLVYEDKPYPVQDGEFDVCVLDNVLEHLSESMLLLNECARITNEKAGLVIVVPGDKGFLRDADHKLHYKEQDLENLNKDWQHLKTISLPFFIKSNFLSKHLSQYCLVAMYKKR